MSEGVKLSFNERQRLGGSTVAGLPLLEYCGSWPLLSMSGMGSLIKPDLAS